MRLKKKCFRKICSHELKFVKFNSIPFNLFFIQFLTSENVPISVESDSLGELSKPFSESVLESRLKNIRLRIPLPCWSLIPFTPANVSTKKFNKKTCDKICCIHLFVVYMYEIISIPNK